MYPEDHGIRSQGKEGRRVPRGITIFPCILYLLDHFIYHHSFSLSFINTVYTYIWISTRVYLYISLYLSFTLSLFCLSQSVLLHIFIFLFSSLLFSHFFFVLYGECSIFHIVCQSCGSFFFFFHLIIVYLSLCSTVPVFFSLYHHCVSLSLFTLFAAVKVLFSLSLSFSVSTKDSVLYMMREFFLSSGYIPPQLFIISLSQVSMVVLSVSFSYVCHLRSL